MKKPSSSYSLAIGAPTTELPVSPPFIPTAEGVIPFGVYKGGLPEIDKFAVRKNLGLNFLRAKLAQKKWRFVGIFSPTVIIGAAIVNTGVVSAAFDYVFDRQTQQLHEFAREVPALGGPKVTFTTEIEHASYHQKQLDFDILTTLAKDYKLALNTPHLEINATLQLPTVFPLEELLLVSRVPDLSTPFNQDSVNVTRKATCFPVQGYALVGDKKFNLDGAFGVLDDTIGWLARETRWRWASASGKSVSDKSADTPETVWGINLVEGHNDYDYTENAIWRDGELTYVGRATFDFDSANPLQPWHIYTDCKTVDLVFTPEGIRKGDVDLGILASVYRAPLGSYSGTLLGEKVYNIPGMAENHRAKW